MTSKIQIFFATTVLLLATLGAGALRAQSGTGGPEQAAVSQHHLLWYGVTKDMSREMSIMTDEISKGDLTPAQRKQMSQRMERMSEMMHRMSDLAVRPAMKDAESGKQMERMRKQMDEIMRNRLTMPQVDHPSPAGSKN